MPLRLENALFDLVSLKLDAIPAVAFRRREALHAEDGRGGLLWLLCGERARLAGGGVGD